MLKMLILAQAALLLSLARGIVFDIRDFGAVPDDDSLQAEQLNAQAFMDAIVAANYTSEAERTILVPYNHTWSMMPVWADNWSNVNITIDGTILLSQRHRQWPMANEKGDIRDFMMFHDIENVTFSGNGTIDGQGYMWWLREFLQLNPNGRPRMFYIRGGRNLEFTGLKFHNSPRMHLNIKDIDTMYMHDFEIHVDIMGQLELGKLFFGGDYFPGSENGIISKLNGKTLPMFPLNTDGIDVAGKNILIERLNITNFDDAVTVKALTQDNTYSQCSENLIVRDCNIWYGVGMTIGSVTPSDKYACVRNVQFLNHVFHHPLKAIYIKTNPGETSTMLPGSGGVIENITYDNIEIHHPIWWSIYIGPQQQKQPGGGGPGCMLYPLTPCDTQPLIDLRNIVLNNVRSTGNLLTPGIVRCHETNKCTGFVFQNVHSRSWWSLFGLNYITENVEGTVSNSTPVPDFGQVSTDGYQGPQSAFDINFPELFEQYLVQLIRNTVSGQRMATHGYQRTASLFEQTYTSFAY